MKYHEIHDKIVKDGNGPYACFKRREAEVEPRRTAAMVTNCSVRLETWVQISAKDFQGEVGQVTKTFLSHSCRLQYGIKRAHFLHGDL